MLIKQNKFGPLRTFSEEDALNAILFLENSPIPRKKLSEMLELGEGATRTIIDILTTEGILETRKKGCTLTKKGSSELEKIKEKMSAIQTIPPSDLTYNKPATCLVLKNESKNVKNGLEERDVAIKAGSTGATILVNKKNTPYFPDSSTKANISTLPQTQEGDVVILSYGPKQRKAAIAVALHIMKKTTRKTE